MKSKEKSIAIHAYLQDPLVEEEQPVFGFQEIEVTDLQQLADGPTSDRFAVVDYNGTTGSLAPAVKWDANKKEFKAGNLVLNNQNEHTDRFEFHQLNVWAIVQSTLQFFESAQVMGRKLPWGFEGNRLIVVPHAGYGQNAYYDRQSKSLQFYYYLNESDKRPVFTCLSADIINHELGHAILDGIRPHFMESTQVQTTAFHEFFGDITAILVLMRNNAFRRQIAEKVAGNLEDAAVLTSIAEEFGRTVDDKPFLRSARNAKTMASVADMLEPHDVSEVLTAALFDIMIELSKQYIERNLKFKGEDQVDFEDKGSSNGGVKAFWYTIYRMQRMALQPIDFLPPVDVTFRDYALAMLRAELLSNPTDPGGYRKIMFDVFVKRGILDAEEGERILKPDYLFDRNKPKLYFGYLGIQEVMRSRANAYDFLANNRRSLGIPLLRDLQVSGLYSCDKQTRQGDKLPRQHVICYVWYEEILLTGAEYGEHEGKYLAMPCGGTLVVDDLNNVMYWANKPGTEAPDQDDKNGTFRRQEILNHFKKQLKAGAIGNQPAFSAAGLMEHNMPPITMRMEGNTIHLQGTPHMHLHSEPVKHAKRSWQISF